MTATSSGRPALHAPPALRAAVERIEGDARLDAAADRVGALAAERLADGPVGGALRGDWLGHALHPLRTDFPLGCWISAGLLDLVGGRRARPAAQRLVGLGVVLAVPTALAGAADFATVRDRRARRVGVVHAAGNAAVGALYALSWRARRRGAHATGVLLGMAGGTLAWGTGYLGGHLSFVRGVGHGARWGDEDTTASAQEVQQDMRDETAEAAAHDPRRSPTRPPTDVEEERERLIIDAARRGVDPADALEVADDVARTEPLPDALRAVDRRLAAGASLDEAKELLLDQPSGAEREGEG